MTNISSLNSTLGKALAGMSLQARMILGFGSVFTVILVIIYVAYTFGIPFTHYTGSYTYERSELVKKLELVADLKKERFLLWLAERKRDARDMADSEAVVLSLDQLQTLFQNEPARGKKGEELKTELVKEQSYQFIVKRFEKYRANHNNVHEKIQLADAWTGLILASTDDKDVGMDVSNTPAFTNVLKMPTEVSVTLEKNESGTGSHVVFSTAIRSKRYNEEIQAVLIIYCDTDEFVEPMLFSRSGLGNTGEIVLVTQDIKPIMSVKRPMADGKIARVLEDRINAPPAMLAVSRQEGNIAGPDYSGTLVLAAYRKIAVTGSSNWGVVVKQDEAELLSPIQDRVFLTTMLGLIGILISGLLAFVVARRISLPIKALVKTSQEVQDGNLAARASATGGSPEIRVLSESFNSMVDRIQHWGQGLEQEVSNRTIELNKANKELTLQIVEKNRISALLEQNNNMLKYLSKVQNEFISKDEARDVFDKLLLGVLSLTNSQYGFFGQVIFTEGHAAYLKSLAVTNIAWNQETRDYYDRNFREGLEFHNLNNLLGHAVSTGKPVISNDPGSDPRRGGLPEGHPPLNAFLGLPLFQADRLIGVVGIANRPGGYDEQIIDFLSPYLSTSANIFLAYQTEQRRRTAETSLAKANRALRTLTLCSEELIRATDELEFIRKVCEIAMNEGGYVLAWVGIVDGDQKKTVRSLAQEGLSEGFLEALWITYGDDEGGSDPTGRAIRTGQPSLVKDIAHDPVFLPWKAEAEKRGYRSCIALPLFVDGLIFGAIGLYSSEPNDFDEEEIKLLTELAGDLGFGIATLRTRAAAERSREAEKILAIAVEQSTDAVVITDEKGDIQYANNAFEIMCDRSQDELIGREASGIECDFEDITSYPKMWNAALQGTGQTQRIVQEKKDVGLVHMDTSVAPVHDSTGKITNYVAVFRNVTEQVEAEKKLLESQKMEAIGTLAGGIAHDFNNILFAIMGYTELCLKSVPADSKAHSNLNQVLNAGKRAGDMVKQILNFSRQSQTEKNPVLLGPIVKEGLKFLRGSIPTTIEIHQKIEADLPAVWGDATQIHQVLMNLCTNAAHAMRDMKGVLSVNLSCVDVDSEFAAQYPSMFAGKHVRLDVSDTGHGIPPAMLDRIFEPFFTTKKQGEGTGLGLSVVHGIINSHGGTVTVRSELGKGTTFSVYLPAIEEESTPEEAVEVAPALTGNERILVVDDEEILVDMVKDMLEDLGYEVTTRMNGVDALELFRLDPQQFDLVITDFTMPRMTGAELAGELIVVRPDIPVILCTGFSESPDETQLNEWGIRSLIRKPILKMDIAKAIREVLDQVSKDVADDKT